MKKTRLEIISRFLIDVKAVFIAFGIYVVVALITVDGAPEQDLIFGFVLLLLTLLFLFISSFFIKNRSTLLTYSVPSIFVYSFGVVAYLLGYGADAWDHFGITILLFWSC